MPKNQVMKVILSTLKINIHQYPTGYLVSKMCVLIFDFSIVYDAKHYVTTANLLTNVLTQLNTLRIENNEHLDNIGSSKSN